MLSEISIYDRSLGHTRVLPLDLDNPMKETSASIDELEEAYDLLQHHTSNPSLAKPGHRNDDAVNICIACRVLGLDPENWIASLCTEAHITDPDLSLWLEHVERVLPYLGDWGPNGDEGQALIYAIN